METPNLWTPLRCPVTVGALCCNERSGLLLRVLRVLRFRSWSSLAVPRNHWDEAWNCRGWGPASDCWRSPRANWNCLRPWSLRHGIFLGDISTCWRKAGRLALLNHSLFNGTWIPWQLAKMAYIITVILSQQHPAHAWWPSFLHNSSSLFPQVPTSAAFIPFIIQSFYPSFHPSLSQVALFICSHGLYGLRTFGTVCFNFQIAAEPQLFQLSQLHRRRGRLQRQFQAFLATHHRQRAGAQRVLGEVGIRALRSTAGLHLHSWNPKGKVKK